MQEDTLITEKIAALKAAAPSGFALGFHVVFTTPTYMFQTYPRAWLDLYAEKGFLMNDPIVHWGFENTGSVRWSDLKAADTSGILIRAAEFGLAYGVTVAIETDGSRSFGGFSRPDRDFTDAETQDLLKTFTDIHNLTAGGKVLADGTKNALKQLSVSYTHPGP